MEEVIRELQDTLTVVANIQARQAAALKDMAEWMEGQQMRFQDHERRISDHERFNAEHDRKMAEFDDKLNGLIAIVDGSIIRGKQQ